MVFAKHTLGFWLKRTLVVLIAAIHGAAVYSQELPGYAPPPYDLITIDFLHQTTQMMFAGQYYTAFSFVEEAIVEALEAGTEPDSRLAHQLINFMAAQAADPNIMGKMNEPDYDSREARREQAYDAFLVSASRIDPILDGENRAKLLNRVFRIYADTGRREEAIDLMYDLAHEFPPTDGLSSYGLHHNLALYLSAEERLEEAKSIWMDLRTLGDDSPLTLEGKIRHDVQLLSALTSMKDWPGMVELAEEIEPMFELFSPRLRHELDFFNLMGHAHYQLGNFADALKYYEALEELAAEMYGSLENSPYESSSQYMDRVRHELDQLAILSSIPRPESARPSPAPQPVPLPQPPPEPINHDPVQSVTPDPAPAIPQTAETPPPSPVPIAIMAGLAAFLAILAAGYVIKRRKDVT